MLSGIYNIYMFTVCLFNTLTKFGKTLVSYKKVRVIDKDAEVEECYSSDIGTPCTVVNRGETVRAKCIAHNLVIQYCE